MQSSALFAVIIFMFIHNKGSGEANDEETLNRSWFPKVIGRRHDNADVSRLTDNSIPHIINPPKGMEPPTFAAVIFRNSELIGSGAIISKYFVLTVCSVVKPPLGSRLSLVGMTKVQYPFFLTPDDELEIKTPRVLRLIRHPNCNDTISIQPGGNLGLVQTKEPMEEHGSLKYPKFPNSVVATDEDKYILSNYRLHNPSAIDIKQAFWYVITKRVDDDLCKKLLERDQERFIPEASICAPYLHIGDESNCKADHGQPLSFRQNNEDILIGLNIHHHRCGRAKEVASYVSVLYNMEWIKQTMQSMVGEEETSK